MTELRMTPTRLALLRAVGDPEVEVHNPRPYSLTEAGRARARQEREGVTTMKLAEIHQRAKQAAKGE